MTGPKTFSTRGALLSCLMVALPAPLLAADAAGNYVVWGVGQASCNQFVNAVDASDAGNFGHYLAGYLTAINTATEGVHLIKGGQSVQDHLAALRTYCADHRMDSFERAIQALLSAEAAAPTGAEANAGWGRPRPAQ